MSANNVRDIIHLFGQRGIVRPIRHGRKVHRHYELTDLDGRPLRMLTLVDEYTRECLSIDVARRLSSEDA